jgi:AcrR family transcriptional regulator
MRTNERRQHLRAALVEAAERVIAERGLPHLKARDLASAVGCAVGAIYNVFPDLDGLILEVNLRTLVLFEAYIAQAHKDGRPGGAGGGSGAEPSAPVRAPRADAAAGGADRAVSDLTRLAVTYLAFASEHPLRWRALFEHRMAGGAALPDWYLKEQVRLFRYIEEPLGRLCPRLPAHERHLLARTIFSATHGMVSLGLDEKLMSLPQPTLRHQVECVVQAISHGLAADPCRS